MKEAAKLIRVKENTYSRLKDTKFDLRLDTFDEVISELLEEHNKKLEVS